MTVRIGPLTAAIQKARQEAASPSPSRPEAEVQAGIISLYLSDPIYAQVSALLSEALVSRAGQPILPPAESLPPLL